MPMPRRSLAPLPPGPALPEIAPMLLTDGRPFASDDWIAEVKYDGVRMLAQVDAGAVTLKSRNGANATRWFPEVCRALAAVPAKGRFIVDGEVAVLDEYGRSDFDKVMVRVRAKGFPVGTAAAAFCVFDLLVEQGKDLMQLPLLERKARLAKLLGVAPGLLAMTHIEGALAQEFYKQAAALKLEGIVLKRKNSLYVPGSRSADWIRCKRPGATPAQRWSRGPLEPL